MVQFHDSSSFLMLVLDERKNDKYRKMKARVRAFDVDIELGKREN